VTVAIAACSGSGTVAGTASTGRRAASSTGRSPGESSYAAGSTGIVNPSSAGGGTLTFDLSGTPDSTDYQDSSDEFIWDFARLYSMQLMTYRSCPGACGLQLVPDLATGPGVVSDHGLVWTYHIRPDVRFENGQTVTSADVKYGIERTYAKSVLPNGPDYYQVLLQDSSYSGPYASRVPLASITTPNATTIQFHLVAPFSDFNYVVANPESTPVQPSWDTGQHGGARFELHPESTGPYEFRSYTLNKQLTLVPNPYWNPATDPEVRQLVSKIIVNMGMKAATVDSNLLAHRADIDLAGSGVRPATQAKILSTPSLKADADDAITGYVRFVYINLRVIPNLHCREAIEYAANKSALQAAYGGPVTGGIASTVLPPNIVGYQQFDKYNALSMPGGDQPAATRQLKLCGMPKGFATRIAYPAAGPQDARAAEALRAALAAVRIRANPVGYPPGQYYTAFAGDPPYVHAHDLGVAFGAWRASWPDGYGFLDELANGNAIAADGGNVNISEINDPAINSLFAAAVADDNAVTRAALWPEIDRRIMNLAAILPITSDKVLLYRNPNVTNVYVDECYGMYNYAALGLR
jgi:peptide/nickel transport system substrate-binding protein